MSVKNGCTLPSLACLQPTDCGILWWWWFVYVMEVCVKTNPTSTNDPPKNCSVRVKDNARPCRRRSCHDSIVARMSPHILKIQKKGIFDGRPLEWQALQQRKGDDKKNGHTWHFTIRCIIIRYALRTQYDSCAEFIFSTFFFGIASLQCGRRHVSNSCGWRDSCVSCLFVVDVPDGIVKRWVSFSGIRHTCTGDDVGDT